MDRVTRQWTKGAAVHIVIMGCGRVGSSLARSLERLGHGVAVIDQNPTAFRRLGTDFQGVQVTGMGFDRDTLVAAGVERASAFAAVSSGDNSNIISARVARERFGVTHVIARIYDAKRAAVYERLGIPTIATVPWTAERMLRALLGDEQPEEWRDGSGTVALIQLPIAEGWAGRPLAELETALGTRVTCVTRFGAAQLPTASTVLQQDDYVHVAVTDTMVEPVARTVAHPPKEGH